MAFGVFNVQQEATEPSQQARVQHKVKLQDHTLASALMPLVTPQWGQRKSTRFHLATAQPKTTPPGACYKCDQEGH